MATCMGSRSFTPSTGPSISSRQLGAAQDDAGLTQFTHERGELGLGGSVNLVLLYDLDELAQTPL